MVSRQNGDPGGLPLRLHVPGGEMVRHDPRPARPSLHPRTDEGLLQRQTRVSCGKSSTLCLFLFCLCGVASLTAPHWHATRVGTRVLLCPASLALPVHPLALILLSQWVIGDSVNIERAFVRVPSTVEGQHICRWKRKKIRVRRKRQSSDGELWYC